MTSCRLQKIAPNSKSPIQGLQRAIDGYLFGMVNCRFLLLFLRDGLRILLQVARNFLRSRQSLVLENLALRSQLALFEQQVIAGKRTKPQPTPSFHLLWT